MKQITVPDMKKIANLVIILSLIIGLFSGCNKEKDKPPLIPAVESMKIDFSNFNTEKKNVSYSMSKGIENANWENAALVAGYWNSIIVTTLAIPVMIYNLATGEIPVYIENNTWQWTYEAKIFTAVYKARLTAQAGITDVEWKMYISREGSGGFSEFVWLEGTSKSDGTGGQWIINHSSSHKEPVLQIDWSGNGTDITSVKYTYVRVLNDSRIADPNRSSYIEYGKNQSGEYDSFYNIYYYNGLDFSEMNVEWNTNGKHGRVKCEKCFADDKWHCWNGNYINVNCQNE